LIEQNDDEVMVSRVSQWELAIKTSVGKLRIDLPLYNDHRDPFDRLLVAQSLSEPLILLTTDARLARYGSTVRVVA
jgi:PIN domain nuclease of toxin-antitoxin system